MEKCFIVADGVRLTSHEGVEVVGALAYVPKRHEVVPVLTEDQADDFAEKMNALLAADGGRESMVVSGGGTYEYVNMSDAVPYVFATWETYEDANNGIEYFCPTPCMSDSMVPVGVDEWEWTFGEHEKKRVDLVDVWTIERMTESGASWTLMASLEPGEVKRRANEILNAEVTWFIRVVKY